MDTAKVFADGDQTCLRLALVTVAMSLADAVLMPIFRTGLPTPFLSYSVGLAVLTCTVLGPSLWAIGRPRRVPWIGPLAVAVFLVEMVLTAFGIVPIALIFAAAIGCLALALGRTRRWTFGAGTMALWILLLLAILIVSTIQIAGVKYVNFVTDQLMLAGRTDGDMLMHAAMSNGLLYFHLPTNGIDGLRLNHYHFGIDLLNALLARGTGLHVLLAMLEIKVLILVPLLLFSAAWGGLVIGRLLLPGRAFGALALACGSAAIGFLLQSTPIANLTSYSDPLLLSGIFMVLIVPTIAWILTGAAGEDAAHWQAWALAIVGIVLLGAAKISTGFVWAGLSVYWAWRLYGLAHRAFWIVSAVAGVVFIPCYLLFADRSGAGAVLFGTPFFVKRGFARGNYLLPLQIHFQAIVALIWLQFAKRSAAPTTRRFLTEALAIALVVGSLPGLLMQIPGGDAYYFMVSVAWLSLPILVALAAAAIEDLARAKPRSRRIGWSAIGLATVVAIVFLAKAVPLKASVFMAYNALLHTGDRSYYDADNRRGWREDGRRAWKELGLGLFRMAPPPQAGKSLADALRAFKAEVGNKGAAYIPPQSDYWPLVADCDGKATYPMSAAGVPAIDNYVPASAACPQEFSLRGYGEARPDRPDLSDQELCARARAEGFSEVLRIGSLADRSRDRRISCP